MRPLPQAQPQASLPPALLIHGFMGNRDILRPLARTLLGAGCPSVEFVEYPSLSWTLNQIIDHLDAVFETMNPDTPIDCIGHSLGAVAIRAWLKTRPERAHSVRRFISLGAPHRGTRWYRLAPHNLRDALAPNGQWVETLSQGPEQVDTFVIRARHDQNIRPPTSASIPGIPETVLHDVGHNGLLFCPQSHDAILQALYYESDEAKEATAPKLSDA